MLLAALLAGLLGGALGAPAAVAQPTPEPASPTTTAAPAATPPVSGNPGANTWSVSPTGKDPTNPSERPNFTYELQPGATLDDSVTVWNYSEVERTFDVYARDAFNTESGGIDLLKKDKQSTDAGAWVSFAKERVIVPGKAGVAVPISISVPADATPGDHDAGIVASLVTHDAGAGDKKVFVEHRVGVRLYVRVTGPAAPALVIDDMHTTYVGAAAPLGKGRVEVTYSVRNAGNIRLEARQVLTVTGPFGWSLAEREPDDVAELLPGAARSYTATFDDISPAGRVTADVELTPVPPPANTLAVPDLEPIARSSASWAIPWTLLLLLAALLVLRSGFRRLRAVRRRGRADPVAAPTGSSVVEDPAAGAEAPVLSSPSGPSR